MEQQLVCVSPWFLDCNSNYRPCIFFLERQLAASASKQGLRKVVPKNFAELSGHAPPPAMGVMPPSMTGMPAPMMQMPPGFPPPHMMMPGMPMPPGFPPPHMMMPGMSMQPPQQR